MAIKRSSIKDIVRQAIEDTTDALTDEEIDEAADAAADKLVTELYEAYDDEIEIIETDDPPSEDSVDE